MERSPEQLTQCLDRWGDRKSLPRLELGSFPMEAMAWSGRGERIRTSGLYVPNVALYQAKLHPDGVDMSGARSLTLWPSGSRAG